MNKENDRIKRLGGIFISIDEDNKIRINKLTDQGLATGSYSKEGDYNNPVEFDDIKKGIKFMQKLIADILFEPKNENQKNV